MIFESFVNRKAIPEIAKDQPLARDNIYVCDAGGLASKLDHYVRYNGISASTYRVGLLKGDLSLVERSDALLREFEDQVPMSRTFANIYDVVGSMPVIPALLAGHPQNMRRRERLKRPAGPLSVFLETTGSSGVRGVDHRGAAMLALARKLAEYRPVDLWVCSTWGERNSSNSMNAVLLKIETTPLDLGRAVHVLSNLTQTASACNGVLHDRDHQWRGGWSYGSPGLERTWCGEIFKRFLHPGSDVLYVPAAFLSDGWMDPVGWLKTMLVKYGGETIEGYEAPAEDENVDAWR